MLGIERHMKIMDLLKEKGSVSVHKLAKTLYVSEATVRRDLKRLAGAGMIYRSFGGASLVEGVDSEIPLIVRDEKYAPEKEKIARLASRLIKNNDTVVIDSSSTAYKMVPYFKNKNNTVITNSPKVALELSENPGLRVYSTGGYLRENSLSYVGRAAEEMIKNCNSTTMFFSCRGISFDQLSDVNEDEAVLKTLMISHSRQIVALMDHTKFNNTSFSRICGLDCVDYLVTDQYPGKEWEETLAKHTVKLLY